jgi:hypothetical protein
MAIKVVSITGAGHSGSTVLASVLGNHPKIVNVGELLKLHRFGWVRNDNRRCSCGVSVFDCPYWLDVKARWVERVGPNKIDTYIRLQDRFESGHRSWAQLSWGRWKQSEEFQEYATMTAAMYTAIQETSQKSIVVDSSKAPSRAYALLQNPEIDLRLIHLIRDGRGVIWSLMKPRSKDVEAGVPRDKVAIPPWRTTAGWVLRNLESEWVAARCGPNKAMRMTYEGFMDATPPALKRVGNLIDEDFSELSAALGEGLPVQVGHTPGGNRLRMSGAIHLRRDTAWSEQMAARDKALFWQLGGWMARRYGYSRAPQE